jgi:hypothetical protein
MSETDPKKTASAFNKLLKSTTLPKTASMSRSSSRYARDAEDGIKKLANLILTEGIPAAVVRGSRSKLWLI